MFKNYGIYAVDSRWEAKVLEEDRTIAKFLASPESFSPEKMQAFGYNSVDSEADRRPKAYSVCNGVALYSISGTLRSSGNWLTKMFGIPDYGSVGDALAAMALDESVEKVLISFDSPGGAVSGISDVRDAWSQLNAIKPIHVHTPGMLASAALWIGSASTTISASPTSAVGSIGVKCSILNVVEQLRVDGIKAETYVSEGADKKDAGNPTVETTDSERRVLQKHVDDFSKIFKSDLQSSRPQIKIDAYDGGCYINAEALSLGLVDSIATYSEVFKKLVTPKAKGSKGSGGVTNTTGATMKKKVTATMAAAAIELGAAADSFEIISDAEYAALPDSEKASAEANGAAGAAAGTAGSSEDKGAGAAAGTAGTEDKGDDAIVALKAENETLKASLAAAQAAQATAEAKAAADGETLAKFRGVVEANATKYRIGCGFAQMDYSKLTAETLLADHDAMKANFTTTYKAGAVVGSKGKDGEDTDANNQKPINAFEQALYKAVLPNHK